MSYQPLGRDKWGRLVYPWDIVITDFDIGAYIVGGQAQESGLTLHSWPDLNQTEFAACESVVVVLEVSPKMTNYQRYFADLGTLDEIIDALRSDNSFAVFDFQLYVSSFGSGTSWVDWLQQETSI